jgi:hypothetical protein
MASGIAQVVFAARLVTETLGMERLESFPRGKDRLAHFPLAFRVRMRMSA